MVIIEVVFIMFVIAFFLNMGLIFLSLLTKFLPMIVMTWIFWSVLKVFKDE